MIVADTNVISELFKLRPNQNVVDWFARFGPLVALPTVVIGELFAGVDGISDAPRRDGLRENYRQLIDGMRDRVLSFDLPAAREYGRLAAHCRMMGAEVQAIDGQIAALARLRRAPVATRDLKAFRDTDVKIINPWEES